MARTFNGSDDVLDAAATPLGSTPAACSIGGWIKPADITSNNEIGGVYNSANHQDLVGLVFAGGVGGDPVRFTVGQNGVGFDQTDSTSGYSAGVWQHGLGTKNAFGGTACFLNGGNKGTNTTSKTNTVDRVSVGLRNDASPSNPCNGDIADFVLYDNDLNDAEAAALPTGVSAMRVRTDDIVTYLPLVDGSNYAADLFSATVFSEGGTGTTDAAGPPIELPPIFGMGGGIGVGGGAAQLVNGDGFHLVDSKALVA